MTLDRKCFDYEHEQEKEQKEEIGQVKEHTVEKSSSFLKRLCCSCDQAISALDTYDEFTLTFKKHYETCEIIENKKRLSPNINDENNDYILIKLKETNFDENLHHDISDIVREHLEELMSLYVIHHFNSDLDRIEKEIVTIKNADVEIIFERFIRLTILEPNLKTRMKSKGNNVYNLVNGFVGFNGKSFAEREEFYLSRKNNLEFSTSPSSSFANKETMNVSDFLVVVVHGEDGVGKRTYVKEYLVEKEVDRVCLTFDSEHIEDDFRRFAKKLRINCATKTINDLLHDLIFRISQNKMKLLFVFLNVDKFENIKLYMDVFQKLKSYMSNKIYNYYIVPVSLYVSICWEISFKSKFSSTNNSMRLYLIGNIVIFFEFPIVELTI
jgi:hypothetical protein